MFGRQITLFKIFGFEVKLDLSWVFLGALVTWSLAKGYFPVEYEGLSSATYWTMGLVGMAGLFFSIIFHEMAHSLVARHYGLSIRGITLFIFGGIAEMEEEPDAPKTEFLMAIAGPLSSLLLAAIFTLLAVLAETAGPSVFVPGISRYLAFLNTVLAIFNLVPAFPLDGGRVLRSALWRWKGDLRWATHVSSRVGAIFGLALVGLGIVSVLRGDIISGVWLALIGLFIHFAARGSYFGVISRHVLEGEAVGRFMTADPVLVSPDLTVTEFVDGYIYQYFHDLFPVVDGSHLIGCVGIGQIRVLPRDQWGVRTVAQILTPVSTDNTIEYDEDATVAMARMRKPGNSRLMVVRNGRLVGIVALKDMLKFLTLKLEFDENP